MSFYKKYCFPNLKKLDIFGMNISLNYNKDSMYRTAFGGSVTVIFIVILALLFYNNITTLFSKSKVTTLTSLDYSTDPSTLSMDNNNFMIAVKYDQTNFVKRPMVNITFERKHYQRSTIERKQSVPIPLEPCTIEHFGNLTVSSSNWTEVFVQQQLNDYLCIRRNESLDLRGNWENEDFQFLKFTMQKCYNDTIRNGVWQPVCDTPDNILKSIDEDSRIQFLFVNYLIQPGAASYPVQQYLESLFFTVQPEKMYTTANIMMNEQKIVTDESILPYEEINEEVFPNYQSGDYKTSYAIGNFKNYSEIFFIRSKFSATINRSYLKIDQVISYIGGFCQIFLMISAILVSFYNELVYTIELANRLYDFDITNRSNQQLLQKNKYLQTSEVGQRNSLNVNVIDNQCKTPNNNITDQQIPKLEDTPTNVNRDKKRKLTKFKSYGGQDNRIIEREDFGLLPLQQIKNLIMDKKEDKTPKMVFDKKLKHLSLIQQSSQQQNQQLNQLDYPKKDIYQQNLTKNQNQNVGIGEIHENNQLSELSRATSNQATARKLLIAKDDSNKHLHQDDQNKVEIENNIVLPVKESKTLFKTLEVDNNIFLKQSKYVSSQNDLSFNKLNQEDSHINQRLSTLQNNNLIKTLTQFENQSTKNLDIEIDNNKDFINTLSNLKQNMNYDSNLAEEKLKLKMNSTTQKDLTFQKQSSYNNIDTLTGLTPLNNLQKNISIDTSFERKVNLKHLSSLTPNAATASSNNIQKKKNFIFEKLGFYDTKSFLDKELSFIILRDRTISMNMKYLINKLTCGKFYNTYEIKLLNKAQEKIKDDLDIFVMLDRLKEMEKFKKLFLSNEQQVLFNFFPKPLINIEQNQELLSRHSLKQEKKEEKKPTNIKSMKKNTNQMNIKLESLVMVSKAIAKFKKIVKKEEDASSALSDYQKLFICYEKLMNDSQINQDEKQKNIKLFELLGDEMKNIFEIAKMMSLKQRNSLKEGSSRLIELRKQTSALQAAYPQSCTNIQFNEQKANKLATKSKFSPYSEQNLDDVRSYNLPPTENKEVSIISKDSIGDNQEQISMKVPTSLIVFEDQSNSQMEISINNHEKQTK